MDEIDQTLTQMITEGEYLPGEASYQNAKTILTGLLDRGLSLSTMNIKYDSHSQSINIACGFYVFECFDKGGVNVISLSRNGSGNQGCSFYNAESAFNYFNNLKRMG